MHPSAILPSNYDSKTISKLSISELRSALRDQERILADSIQYNEETLDIVSDIADLIASELARRSQDAVLGSSKPTMFILPYGNGIPVKIASAEYHNADVGFQTWGSAHWMACGICELGSRLTIKYSENKGIYKTVEAIDEINEEIDGMQQVSLQTFAMRIGKLSNSIDKVFEFIVNKVNRCIACQSETSMNLRILELGSGTGLVGLAMALIFKEIYRAKFPIDLKVSVTLTDYNKTVVDNLRGNVVHNELDDNGNVQVTVSTSDWRWILNSNDSTSTAVNELELVKNSIQSFDIILASDCAYDINVSPLLSKVVNHYLDKSGIFWTIWPLREQFGKESQRFEDGFNENFTILTTDEFLDEPPSSMKFKSVVFTPSKS